MVLISDTRTWNFAVVPKSDVRHCEKFQRCSALALAIRRSDLDPISLSEYECCLVTHARTNLRHQRGIVQHQVLSISNGFKSVSRSRRARPGRRDWDVSSTEGCRCAGARSC